MHKKYAAFLMLAGLVAFVYLNILNPVSSPLAFQVPVGLGLLGAVVFAFGGRLEGEKD